MNALQVIYGRLLHRWRYLTDLSYADQVDRVTEKERRDWEIKKLRYLASAIILSADKPPGERIMKHDNIVASVAACLEPEVNVRNKNFHAPEPDITEGWWIRSLLN